MEFGNDFSILYNGPKLKKANMYFYANNLGPVHTIPFLNKNPSV